jgi:hypothetical protein
VCWGTHTHTHIGRGVEENPMRYLLDGHALLTAKNIHTQIHTHTRTHTQDVELGLVPRPSALLSLPTSNPQPSCFSRSGAGTPPLSPTNGASKLLHTNPLHDAPAPRAGA